MRKWMVVLLLLVSALLVAPTVEATGLGVGAFGGVSIPIVQKDAAQGIVAGAHVRLSLIGMLGVEPNFTYMKDGDWKVDDLPGVTFKGSKVSAYGVNLILGGAGPFAGVRFFPFIGGKIYNLKKPELNSDSQIGWNLGVGLEFGIGNLGIEARAAGELMKLKPKGSRKWAHITAGLNYYFGAL